MAKIRRSAKKLPVLSKKQVADQIGAAVPLSAYAAALATVAGAMTTKAAAMKTLYDEAKALEFQTQQKFAALETAVEDFDDALDDVYDLAQEATDDSEAGILSLAMECYNPGDAPPLPPFLAPANLSASFGDFPGSVDLQWDKIKGARSFFIQMTTTPANEASWASVGASVKSSHTVTGLVSGTVYYFRVAAFGTPGQSPWSDLVEKRAP